jgi:hypothetical protein
LDETKPVELGCVYVGEGFEVDVVSFQAILDAKGLVGGGKGSTIL